MALDLFARADLLEDSQTMRGDARQATRESLDQLVAVLATVTGADTLCEAQILQTAASIASADIPHNTIHRDVLGVYRWDQNSFDVRVVVNAIDKVAS